MPLISLHGGFTSSQTKAPVFVCLSVCLSGWQCCERATVINRGALALCIGVTRPLLGGLLTGR